VEWLKVKALSSRPSTTKKKKKRKKEKEKEKGPETVTIVILTIVTDSMLNSGVQQRSRWQREEVAPLLTCMSCLEAT
jgi:hypothetical protein